MGGSIIWPQNRLKWGRGSERPAAHTQQKLTQVLPPPPLPLRGLEFSKLKELSKYNRTDNCEKLTVPKFSPEIWNKSNKLKHVTRSADLRKYLSKSVVQWLNPLTLCWLSVQILRRLQRRLLLLKN